MKTVSIEKYNYDDLNAKIKELADEMTEVKRLVDTLNTKVEELEKISERVLDLDKRFSDLVDNNEYLFR